MDDLGAKAAEYLDELTAERKSIANDGPIALSQYRGTDESNASLFRDLHGQDVRFCPPWGKWLLWTGTHWQIDNRLEVDRLGVDLSRHLYGKASKAFNSSERKEIVSLALRLEATKAQSSMLSAVKPHVVIHHEELDQGHFLLNASNGTVDLRTGKLHPHSRSDYLTHNVGIAYDPNANAPTWNAFLETVFNGDTDLIAFLWRAVGYGLTGDVREQVIFIPYGMGSNGKSVWLNVLRALLGKLAFNASANLLLKDRNSNRHPTEKADLFRKRLILTSETEKGRRFDEETVKTLTGGDPITARRMREDFWEFEPTHKLWLATNHRPEIRGTDHAIWRRIRLIPFTTTFHEQGAGTPVKDPTMEARLMTELPGILAWAVRGCLDWQRNGLGQSEAVKSATAAYQADMDVLAGWIGENCVVGRQFDGKASVLYADYVEWCGASGENPEKQRAWGMSLSERGFLRYSSNGTWYRGIGLKA